MFFISQIPELFECRKFHYLLHGDAFGQMHILHTTHFQDSINDKSVIYSTICIKYIMRNIAISVKKVGTEPPVDQQHIICFSCSIWLHGLKNAKP